MNPLKLLKRFVSPRPLSVHNFNSPYLPRVMPKTYARLCEITSQTVAGRDFIYAVGDGLHILLLAGLKRVLKEAIDISAQKGLAYILLHFDDATDDLSLPVGDFSRWEFGSVVGNTPTNRHSSRTLIFSYWKSIEEREALQAICRLFDQSAWHLGEGLSCSLRPQLHLGDLSSLMDTRSYSAGELEELKSLLTRLSTTSTQILGREDTLTTLSPPDSLVGIFSSLAGYLSFLSGIPLSFLLPQEKEDPSSQVLFQGEINNLCELAVRPAIEELLYRLGLSSQWRFKELSSTSERERADTQYKRAQTASLWVETLQASGALGSEAEEGMRQSFLSFLNGN